ALQLVGPPPQGAPAVTIIPLPKPTTTPTTPTTHPTTPAHPTPAKPKPKPKPKPAPKHQGTYVVRKGGTLSGIAARFHVAGGWPAWPCSCRPPTAPGGRARRDRADAGAGGRRLRRGRVPQRRRLPGQGARLGYRRGAGRVRREPRRGVPAEP